MGFIHWIWMEPVQAHNDAIKEALMKKCVSLFVLFLVLCPLARADKAADTRQLVQLPPMMQEHMLLNMRDHLFVLNELLALMANDELDAAAELAESRLGMSSLEKHGAEHMSKFMPEGMRQAGSQMHRAASRFAQKAEEGELLPAYRSLQGITSACVACHGAYRIR